MQELCLIYVYLVSYHMTAHGYSSMIIHQVKEEIQDSKNKYVNKSQRRKTPRPRYYKTLMDMRHYSVTEQQGKLLCTFYK